jgi:hypothetical protein
MKTIQIRLLLLSLAIASLLAACKSLRMEDVPGGDNLMSAAAFMGKLKQEGKLPGVQPDDYGSMRSVPLPLPSSADTVEPLQVDLMITIQDKEDSTFWYRVSRPDKNTPWQLVEAWQTDAKGKNRVDLPLKPGDKSS